MSYHHLQASDTQEQWQASIEDDEWRSVFNEEWQKIQKVDIEKTKSRDKKKYNKEKDLIRSIETGLRKVNKDLKELKRIVGK